MKVHLQANTASAISVCGRRNVVLTNDPSKVTCKKCKGKYVSHI